MRGPIAPKISDFADGFVHGLMVAVGFSEILISLSGKNCCYPANSQNPPAGSIKGSGEGTAGVGFEFGGGQGLSLKEYC